MRAALRRLFASTPGPAARLPVQPPGRATGAISAAPNPVLVAEGEDAGSTGIYWTSTGVEWVEVHVGAADGPLLSRSGPGNSSQDTGPWVGDGTVFYLQDVTGDAPLLPERTLATVTVEVQPREPIA